MSKRSSAAVARANPIQLDFYRARPPLPEFDTGRREPTIDIDPAHRERDADSKPPQPVSAARLIGRVEQAFRRHRALVEEAWREHLVDESLHGNNDHLGEPAPHWFVVELGLLQARATKLLARLQHRRQLELSYDPDKPRSIWYVLSRWTQA